MRTGNFTSSEIVALTGTAKREMTEAELAVHKSTNPKSKAKLIVDLKVLPDTAYTYIEEKNFERRLKRSLDAKVTARALSWGKLCEVYLFQHKGLIQYTPLMDEPKQHPMFNFWLGSPDAINNSIDAVTELKCPQTLKSFCQLVEPLRLGLTGMDAINAIRFGFTDKNGLWHDKHSDGEKYYWQIVSNAIITRKNLGELIIFCPQKSELQALRDLCQQMPTDDLGDYYWIANSNDEQLPYLLPESDYQSFNSIVFEIPQSDIDFITSRVLMAEKHLTNSFVSC